jgi:hypothetical protein
MKISKYLTPIKTSDNILTSKNLTDDRKYSSKPD